MHHCDFNEGSSFNAMACAHLKWRRLRQEIKSYLTMSIRPPTDVTTHVELAEQINRTLTTDCACAERNFRLSRIPSWLA